MLRFNKSELQMVHPISNLTAFGLSKDFITIMLVKRYIVTMEGPIVLEANKKYGQYCHGGFTPAVSYRGPSCT